MSNHIPDAGEMAHRCEPDAALRGEDGWHWVWDRNGMLTMAWWHASEVRGIEPKWHNLWDQTSATPVWAWRTWGWRYYCPVASPGEVAALRADAAKLCDERDAVAIAFRKLGAVMRVNMLRHAPASSHGEIDRAIAACLGPTARRVLADAPDAPPDAADDGTPR